jgi:hypothetical protein
MKKLIQISLILMLVLVSIQVVVGAGISSGSIGSRNITDISYTADTSAEGVQTAACFIKINGVICVTPNVGWNS